VNHPIFLQRRKVIGKCLKSQFANLTVQMTSWLHLVVQVLTGRGKVVPVNAIKVHGECRYCTTVSEIRKFSGLKSASADETLPLPVVENPIPVILACNLVSIPNASPQLYRS
jgi:hypothetical protein